MRDPLRDIITERLRQDKQWGVQIHAPLYWMTILGEEYGEACCAVLEDWPNQYRDELVHVAAVALAAIESFDTCLLRDRGRDILTL